MIACWAPWRSCSRIHEIWLGADVTWSQDISFSSVYLAVDSTADYERLCTLDVLGLVDTPMGDQGDVYDELRNSYHVLLKDAMKPHCPGEEIIGLSLTTTKEVFTV